MLYRFDGKEPKVGKDSYEGAIVAEGAVVKIKQVIPPKTVVGGNPAQIIRETTAKDQEFWGWGKQGWNSARHTIAARSHQNRYKVNHRLFRVLFEKEIKADGTPF